MNRAIRSMRAGLLGIALLGAYCVSFAQQDVNPGMQIPADAKQSVLEVGDNGEISLGGKPARLSPAAQIRDTTNLIVLPQALHGKYRVRVTFEPDGSIRRAWIVRP